MSTQIGEALSSVLVGDAGRIAVIDSAGDQEILDAAHGRTLVLRPEAVARVLADFGDGRIAAAVAQRWASFVRYGMVAGRRASGIAEIEIEYEAAHEDEIATAVGRLDELGDLIDGEFFPGEIDQLLAALTRP